MSRRRGGVGMSDQRYCKGRAPRIARLRLLTCARLQLASRSASDWSSRLRSARREKPRRRRRARNARVWRCARTLSGHPSELPNARGPCAVRVAASDIMRGATHTCDSCCDLLCSAARVGTHGGQAQGSPRGAPESEWRGCREKGRGGCKDVSRG